ncbi:MarC family protein [uncultured Victivallis sp.]|uniref:MarC family protein n=1 Tax=Victivallis sp. TaxID=2049020 RepID=UPI0025FF5AB0|nr:MarC family protein [uncultured Victivallis sp.]
MTATLFTSIQILILLNPFAVLSTFLAMTPRWTERERRMLVLRAMITVIVAGVTLFFGGSVIFSLFGINIDVFRIGGGVILMVCAISLIWGKAGAADDNGDDPGHDIAVVPIAIPMAVGPGTAAGLIVIGLENHGLWMTVSNLAALGFATALLAGLLLLGTRAERLLRRRGIAIITRLTGLFLSAIAAGMILDGVKSFFHL